MDIIDKFESLQKGRHVWNNHYQVLGEYISQVKQNFEQDITPGEFLHEDIFDSTGTFAAESAASSLLGLLWPGTARQSIEITPPDGVKIDSVLSEFYQDKMTDRTVRAMDDPKANLILSLDEYMLDQLIFGTSGVGVERGKQTKLLYTPYGVKQMYIDEGAGGRVTDIYLYYEWTAKRVVDEYGIENVSEKVKKKYESGKQDEKVKIIVAIRPRREFKASQGVLSMPIEGIHIEKDTKNILKETGFEELPIPVTRFRKLIYERYGRSPGMKALPDIRELNALREAVIVATEKVLDMPKGVYSDGVLGGGIIDTSAKAINVFADMGGQTPIFDIGSPPDINAALARIEDLKNSIAQHFHIDRLLDFNNEQQMTFGEAQIRNQIRMASLSSLFSRQITELFTPLIERSVNILFREGEFGVIPGSEKEEEILSQGKEPEYLPEQILEMLQDDEPIYEVRYKTQAGQASRAEEYLAIIETTQYAAQAMQVDPTLADRVNLHEAIKELSNIRSVPTGIIRQDDEYEEIQNQRQQQAQQQQGLEAADQIAGIAEKAANAQDKAQNI